MIIDIIITTSLMKRGLHLQGTNKNTEKLWTKYYFLTFVYAMSTQIANNMLMTGLPLYAIHLGGDNSISGMLFGFFMFVAIIFRPLFGKIIDEKSRRMVLIIGAVVTAFITLSYVVAFSISLLLVMRSLHGIGFSATTNASGTVISDIVPKRRLAEGVGYFGLSNTLATAVGPALTIYLIQQFNYQVLFIVAGLIGLISILCSLFITYEKGKTNVERKSSTRKRKISELLYEKTALPTALVTAFVYVGMGVALTFIPTFALSLGIEDIGFYYTVYSIALLLTRIIGGKLADKYGSSLVIIPGLVIMTISFVVLAYAHSLSEFIISGILYGLGLGFVEPALNAVMIKLCPPNRRGAGNSTFFTAKDSGSGIGAICLGFISLHAGFKAVFLYSALSIIFAFFAYVFILRRQIIYVKTAESSNIQEASV
ncbi:MFS transporter [Fredinandcohnia sp. QZ13]|uniref:MFS transporter n=1 Tax=Fredinandcohnia sp. QZ13 TaxID=3073144 RepID=UPI0028536CF4|nr:MFS transporter [Fredinandcohnia sp. QZ13]MDR4886785.1 MFS transporter [Fredinandcohnia sp. QZ13]